MAKPDKEKCPRCGSSIFAKATDKSGKLYCQAKGCGHVWVPGLDGMKRIDVVLKQSQEENIKLLAEVTKLRVENADLKAKLEELNPPVDKSEAEIFS